MSGAVDQAALSAIGRDLLEEEGACLDERRWDDWLALYSPQCEYWVPMWRNEETLTDDPQRELSHIYYASRAGLEDRVMRIKTRRSPSSVPMPRTVHMLGYARFDGATDADRFAMRSAWTCQVFLPVDRVAQQLFGLSHYEFAREGDGWKILKRHTQLQNDYIATMLDIYCL